MKRSRSHSVTGRIIQLLYLCFLIISFACQHDSRKGQCQVSGKITGKANEYLKLKELGISDIVLIDSLIPDQDGSFQVNFSNDSHNVFALQLDQDHYLTLILGRGDSVLLDIDASESPLAFTVKGNKESELMAIYEDHTNRNLFKVDSLRSLFDQSKDEPGFYAIRSLIDQAYQGILIDQQLFARDFIRQNPGSMASLVVLNRNFKQIRLFDEIEDFDYYTLVDSGLMKTYPGNKHVAKHHEITQKIHQKITSDAIAASKLAVGREIPDMSMNGLDGRHYELRDLRGNMVLLYFWAAWDARSRQVNRELKAIYDEYKEKGLVIYAVSLDIQEELWKSAIKLDQLDWIHGCDLKGLNSPVIKLYQVPERLPSFYLVDRDGIILYKGNKSSELEEILSSSMQKSS